MVKGIVEPCCNWTQVMRLISDLDEVGDIVAVGTGSDMIRCNLDACQYSWVTMWKWNLEWYGMVGNVTRLQILFLASKAVCTDT